MSTTDADLTNNPIDTRRPLTRSRTTLSQDLLATAQPHSKQHPLANRFSANVLCAVVALAPLPFGSIDPLSVAVWCIMLSVALAGASIAGLGRRRNLILICIVCVVAAFCFVLHEQLASVPWVATPDPIWAASADALREARADRAAVTLGQPLFALGPALACALSVSLGLIVGAERAHARRILNVIAWSGAAYAAYGIVSAIFEPNTLIWVERIAYSGSVIGTFVQRNTAAIYFGCVANVWFLLLCEDLKAAIPPGGLTWKVVSRHLIPRMPRRVMIRFAGTFICLMAVLMSGSRAGALLSLIAMATVGLVMFWAERPRQVTRMQWFIGAGVAVFVLLQVFGAAVNSRFDTSGLSDEGRFDIDRATLIMIKSHPWFGTGLGTFTSAFPTYRTVPPNMRGIWVKALNTPLEMAAEVGMPLTIMIGGALLGAMAVMVMGVARREHDRVIPFAGAIALGLGLVHGCIDYSLQIPGFAIVAMGLAGVGLARSVSRKTRNRRRTSPPQSPAASNAPKSDA